MSSISSRARGAYPAAKRAQSLYFLCIALLLFVAGCAPSAPPVKRIALLAPFEGAYREIGYDAIYPVRMALKDSNTTGIEILSLDTGGSAEIAAAHAASLAADPTVLVALVIGAEAASPAVLDAFGDMPVIVIGDWNAKPTENTFVLAAAQIAQALTSHETDIYAAAALEGVIGGETFGLKAFPRLAENAATNTILTSAAPPTAEFNARLIESGLYVPSAGLPATLAYDAGSIAAGVLATSAARADVDMALRTGVFTGINGEIRFAADGYWADAPVYTYRYENGVLTTSD